MCSPVFPATAIELPSGENATSEIAGESTKSGWAKSDALNGNNFDLTLNLTYRGKGAAGVGTSGPKCEIEACDARIADIEKSFDTRFHALDFGSKGCATAFSQ